MVAQIKLRKITGIKVGDNSSTDSSNFPNQINGLQQGKQIIFAGNDYKGDFKVTQLTDVTFYDKSNNQVVRPAIIGNLELYLEKPENHFSIQQVHINKQGSHSMSTDKKEVTIQLLDHTRRHPEIQEKDTGYFTTELSGNIKSLKFSDWSDYDFSDKSYVDISFV